jgi:hypothetical protein
VYEHYSAHERIGEAASGLVLIAGGIYSAIFAREGVERSRDRRSIRLIRKFSLIKTSLEWDVAFARLISVLVSLAGLFLVILAIVGNTG